MPVESWFFEDNAKPFVQTVAALAGYDPGDEYDWLVLSDGLRTSDAEGGRWVEHEFGRTSPIRLALARDSGTGVVLVRCSADAETEGKIDFLVSLAQSYQLTKRSGGTGSPEP
jgi:hypothetical protein